MPNLLSRSKHEEFESNSALQIRNQKERRVEEGRKMKQCRRFWQDAKISHLGAKFPFPARCSCFLLLTFSLLFVTFWLSS